MEPENTAGYEMSQRGLSCKGSFEMEKHTPLSMPSSGAQGCLPQLIQRDLWRSQQTPFQCHCIPCKSHLPSIGNLHLSAHCPPPNGSPGSFIAFISYSSVSPYFQLPFCFPNLKKQMLHCVLSSSNVPHT